MKKENVSLSEIKKILTGKVIYVRCKDARFIVTRASFENSCKRLGHKPYFNIEFDERKIMIEEVNQFLHQPVPVNNE